MWSASIWCERRGFWAVDHVSRYLQFSDSRIPEWEFVGEVALAAVCYSMSII
jgi:hypothetical protein